MSSTEANVVSRKNWHLEPESEYRFELDPGTSLAIKLVRGHAEVFGSELAEGKQYLFGAECKAAVFTWRGCTIEMSHPSTEYVSDETPMAAYANLHIAFEQMRVRALAAARGSPPRGDEPNDPPRVLVLGPENSGKTTVSKILVNYAVRAGQGWTPLLVNVDPNEGAWAAPGAISAAPVSSPIPTCSPANPLGSAATSAPTALPANALLPLVYWYGHAETRRNPLLMDRLVRNLGENVREKYEVDMEARVSGLIVDTPSSFGAGTGAGDHRHKLIKACVDAFKINVILVVGHEKLNVEMQRTYGSQLTVVKVPKSGGVVELDHSYRERVHNNQLHTYMYGQIIAPPAGVPPSTATAGGEALTELTFAPSSTVIGFDDLTIFRVGAETMAPSSALPIGATRVVSEMQPVPVDPAQPGSGLLNAVLGLLASPNADESERYDEEILDLTITGFLIIGSKVPMSAFARLLRAQPANRRAYSSFFSSKPGGGGRYFTSAKPPKVVKKVDEATADAAPSTVEQPSPSPTPSTSASTAPASTPEPVTIAPNNVPHPMVNPKDFKLHQFFSLHRPLLLLSRPHSILDSTNAASFLPEQQPEHPAPKPDTPQWLLDEFPDVSSDADAATARQLSRALTMNHAGATVAWEDTLRRLGLDVNKDADRVGLQEKWDKEWQDVLMDSTKRKRKKKMKKHKLKKRRKVFIASIFHFEPVMTHSCAGNQSTATEDWTVISSFTNSSEMSTDPYHSLNPIYSSHVMS
ncbi:Cleavage polyadenylation factor subunit clp1 [Blastosporella zonata]|nr:Cleavage polyadenylation factor subunit clp1 [Blastosporella zonata]